MIVDTVLAVLIVVAAGLPLSYALTRSVPLAVVLAPVAGAAVATAAVLLMLAFTGPLLLWFAPVYVATAVLAWRMRGRARVQQGTWRDALLVSLPVVPPLLHLAQEPITWDTHLIWWLHSGYFAGGGDFARTSIGNPALVFSHPDYPPLASAPVSLAWEVLDIRTFYPAAMVTGALTFSAIAMLVYAVRLATAAGPALLSWAAAVAVGLSAWTPLWIVPTSGFSDAMCATAFAAGAVLLLFKNDRAVTPVALLLCCSAALMKNEGLSLVVALAVVGTVKYRRDLVEVAWLWLPVGVAGLWSVTARLLGAETDVLAGGRFDRLLAGDADTWGRLPLILSTIGGRIGWVTLFAFSAAVLAAFVLRDRRGKLAIGADPWLWAVAALHGAGLVFIYLITPSDIKWHLSTSVDRVVIALVVLACASAACWGVVALAPQPREEPVTEEPEPARVAA